MNWLGRLRKPDPDKGAPRTRTTVRDERISTYLEGELPPADHAAIERDLEEDADLQTALEGMRIIRDGLGELGMQRAPRNFTITASTRSRRAALPRIEFALRLATATAAVGLAGAIIGPTYLDGSRANDETASAPAVTLQARNSASPVASEATGEAADASVAPLAEATGLSPSGAAESAPEASAISEFAATPALEAGGEQPSAAPAAPVAPGGAEPVALADTAADGATAAATLEAATTEAAATGGGSGGDLERVAPAPTPLDVATPAVVNPGSAQQGVGPSDDDTSNDGASDGAANAADTTATIPQDGSSEPWTSVRLGLAGVAGILGIATAGVWWRRRRTSSHGR